MSELGVADCVAIWNGEANAEVRAAAAALGPREVHVGIVEASVGVAAAPTAAPRWAVFLRDPGGEGLPPSMLTIPMAPDRTRFDRARATENRGAGNTSLGGAPNAQLADDGTLSFRHPSG